MKYERESLRGELIRFLETKEIMPLAVVLRHLRQYTASEDMGCSEHELLSVIEESLDDWQIAKAVEHSSPDFAKELNLPLGEPVWHLKYLTEEESDEYRSLSDAEKALVKILWQQDDTSHLGEMPVDTAVEQLAQRGFTEGTEYLGSEGIVYDFFTYWNHEDRHTYGIVPEFMKTEEYKREAERQSERVLEKMKEWEEIDAADKARTEQKKKKGRKG